jgi:hypothetical protein
MNQEIREKLIALQKRDLEIRQRLVESGKLFDGYSPEMEEAHKENAEQLREIIKRFGWPGKSLVGEDGAYAAWFVLQHDIGEPDFIRSCISLLQEAAQKGELPKKHIAMTIDRVKIYEGKEQVYGTHYDWDDNGEISPVFLENPEKVDERRAGMDLPPLAENIKRIREETKKENNKPPADIRAYRKKAEDWYRLAGWR